MVKMFVQVDPDQPQQKTTSACGRSKSRNEDSHRDSMVIAWISGME